MSFITQFVSALRAVMWNHHLEWLSLWCKSYKVSEVNKRRDTHASSWCIERIRVLLL